MSALLASSATAFSVVKYAGAAYLIFLGIRRLLDGDEPEPGDDGPADRKQLFWQGVVVNSLNPKTALFFLAFLPQFVDPDRGAVAPQVLALGVLFLVLATLSDSTYALVAGSVRGCLGGRRRALARASGLQLRRVGLARGAVARVELERAGVDAVAQAALRRRGRRRRRGRGGRRSGGRRPRCGA